MKKQVTGVILGLAALCTNLSADGWNGDCCYDQCGGGSFLDGITLGARGLLLWGCEENLNYAAIETITDQDEFTLYTIDNRRPRFKSRLGYEVELAYASPCSCWGLEAKYFHFNSNARNRIAAPEDSFLIPTISSFVAINDIFGFQFAAARHKYNINRVDLNVGRMFCIGECFELEPSAGVRWLGIDQRLNVFFADLEEDETIFDDLALRSKYDGVGLRGGLDSRWHFCGGFSLYGGFGTAILCGNSRVNRLEVLSILNGTVPFNAIIAARSRHHQTVWMGETELGIAWETCFCGSQTLRVKLGWEYMLFANVGRFDETTLAIPTATAAQSRGARQADLTLQGFVFGAEYTF